MQGRDSKDDRSLGELFSELAQDTSTLVRKEVQLAKTEMSQKASRVGKDVGFLAVGGAVAYAALLAVLAGVIVLLGQVIPMWLSALLVGLVVAGVGYFLVRRGLDALKREDLAPRQTTETIKEDQQWAKDQMR
jgi:Putative Actinobacterial Holin-X, holin superfamily III